MHLSVVTVAVDTYVDGELSGVVVGAYSTSSDVTDPHLLLDATRAALGASWAPATFQEISDALALRQREPIGWEQISLF